MVVKERVPKKIRNALDFFDKDYFEGLNKAKEAAGEEMNFSSFFDKEFKENNMGSFVYWMLKNRSLINRDDVFYFMENSNLENLNKCKDSELVILNELLQKKLNSSDYTGTIGLMESKMVDVSFISDTDIFADLIRIVGKGVDNIRENEAMSLISVFRERLPSFELLIESMNTKNRRVVPFDLQNTADIINTIAELKKSYPQISVQADDSIAQFFEILLENKASGVLKDNADYFFSRSAIEKFFLGRYAVVDVYNQEISVDYSSIYQLCAFLKVFSKDNENPIMSSTSDILSNLSSDGLQWTASDTTLVALLNNVKDNSDLNTFSLINIVCTLARNTSNYEIIAYVNMNVESIPDFAKGQINFSMVEMLGKSFNRTNSVQQSVNTVNKEAMRILGPKDQIIFELKALSLHDSVDQFTKRSEEIILPAIHSNIKNKLYVHFGKLIREQSRNDLNMKFSEESLRTMVENILIEHELLQIYNDHLTRQARWEKENEVAPIEPVYFTELMPNNFGVKLQKKYALEFERKNLLSEDQVKEEQEQAKVDAEEKEKRAREKAEDEGIDYEEMKKEEEERMAQNAGNQADVPGIDNRKGIKFNLEYFEELFRHRDFFFSMMDLKDSNIDSFLKEFILNQ